MSSLEIQMTSSYKTCYRRNAVLQHAHSKQSSSLENRLSTSTRSIDSDVQKLQKQLMGYKVRQSQCSPSPTSSTCSSPTGGNLLSARVKMLKGCSGDMVHSAPDITMLFNNTPPTSPRLGGRQRTSSGTKCISPLLQPGEGNTPNMDRRGSLDSRRTSYDHQKKVQRQHQDLRRMVQESPLLSRRRATSPDTMLPPCSSLEGAASGSYSSLNTSPTGEREDRSSTQSSPCQETEECRRHSKPKVGRKRSKSFDEGIKTVEDITKFFDKLRGTKRAPGAVKPGKEVLVREEVEESKLVILPPIEPRFKNPSSEKCLPELIITNADEQG